MRGSTAGLAEGIISHPASIYATWLDYLDYGLSSIVLAPIIISYWRATWNLMGYVLFQNNILFSALASTCIGFGGHLIFTIFQKRFKKKFQPDKHRLTYFIGSRMYTAIYGVVCVNGWRGVWLLLDIYVPYNFYIVFSITFACILLLAFLKTLRNISATPFAIATDEPNEYFTIPTMYKLGTQEPVLYVLDCLFSVLVIGTLVVFVWRGLWVLCDLKLYPQDPTNSAWGSLMIGYAIVGITFLLQSWMRWVCDRLTGYYRLLAADIFLIFAFIGTVNVWRGVWQILDIYFLPDYKLLGDIITHSVPFIILTLMRCSNSVLVRGVYIDAEEPAGQCVIFPVYFIRLLCQKERIKKQKKITEALTFGSHNNNNNNNNNNGNGNANNNINNNPNSMTTGLLLEKSSSIRIVNQQHHQQQQSLLSDLSDHDHDLINNNSISSKGLLNVSLKTTPFKSSTTINTNYNNNIQKLNNTIDNSIISSSTSSSSSSQAPQPPTTKSIDLTTNILNINEKINDKINNDSSNLSDEFTKLFPKDLR